jgi:hypothetical protein
MTALSAVTTETPQWQHGRRGGIQIEPKALFSWQTLTLHLQQQSSPFCNKYRLRTWARARYQASRLRLGVGGSNPSERANDFKDLWP